MARTPATAAAAGMLSALYAEAKPDAIALFDEAGTRSFGALHAMNLFLKRPDLFGGVISMSGVYDLSEYTKGFFDDQVYFNSPIHYIPNLEDHGILERHRAGKIVIATGSGSYEDPEANRRFSQVLHDKSIPHELDVWGDDIHHDWPTWRRMLPHFIETRF